MDKNTRTLVLVFSIVVAMIGLAFASLPLYDAFCRVTGFGGTPLLSEAAPSEDEILDRKVTVYFNADTNRDLNWNFRAEKNKIEVRIGEQKLINFIAENKDSNPIAGTAVYNVTPLKAGKYFHKTQCFCFDRQVLT
ncbi:MAG: cytochrome c oxidase assembly protein, partial [Pseudomonadota bacterium]